MASTPVAFFKGVQSRHFELLWSKYVVIVLTPAFSVTCIGGIFVYLSTCHLSTGYVTWPTSKCQHNGLFHGQTRRLATKDGFI